MRQVLALEEDWSLQTIIMALKGKKSWPDRWIKLKFLQEFLKAIFSIIASMVLHESLDL
jgi:hypothetical protein